MYKLTDCKIRVYKLTEQKIHAYKLTDDQTSHAYELTDQKSHGYELMDGQKSHAYDLVDQNKSCVRADGSEKSCVRADGSRCKSRADERVLVSECGKTVELKSFPTVKGIARIKQVADVKPIVRDPMDHDKFLVESGAETTPFHMCLPSSKN